MAGRLRMACVAVVGSVIAAGARAQDEPAPAPPGDPPIPAASAGIVDDPIVPFVPRRPRDESERDRLDALRDYVAARALEDRRLWEDAIALLEQARKKDPEAVAIVRRLARLYFALGRIEQGIDASLEVLAVDPQDAATIRQLVRSFRQSNDGERAEALLKGVLENPALPRGSTAELLVQHDLGLLYADLGRDADAAAPLGRLVEALDSRDAARLSPGDLDLILGGDPAGAYRRFGEIFYTARDYDHSIIAFRRSLAYEPDSLQTPLLLTQSLVRADRAAEALELLEPIVAKRPPGRLAFDVLGQVLRALGREAEVTARFESAREADPRNVLLAYALAERYEQAGEVERARRLYRQVISEQPDPQGIAALAGSLRQEGKLDELLQLFETAMMQPVGRMAIEPQVKLIATDAAAAGALLDAGLELMRAEPPRLGPAGRLVLVQIATRAELPEKLVELDRLNLERDPSTTTYRELAGTLAMAGRYAEAADLLQELRAKFPDQAEDPQVLNALAINQFQAGRLEDSIETARGLLERDPDDFGAIELIGFALNKLGRTDEAIALYRDVLQRFADNPDAAKLAHIWLSSAYSAQGDAERAEAELLALLEADPDDAWVNNDLGYLWAERDKNLERAEEMTRKAVDQEPENGSYLDSLGWVLFKRGKLDEAVPILERAERTKPTDATILDHLGDAYYRLGRTREAREKWRRAEELLADGEPPDKLLAKVREKLTALGESDEPATDPEPNP